MSVCRSACADRCVSCASSIRHRRRRSEEQTMKAANRHTRRPAIHVPMPDREGPYTFNDYINLIPDGVKADLLDGVIYMASPDHTDAGDLTTWLGALIASYVEVRGLGK